MRPFGLFSRNSGNQLGDWLGSFNPDQTLGQPSIEIAQTIGVQPHLLQDGCVYSFDVHPVLDSCCPELIRLSEAHTAFDSAAGHPHGEAVRMVVTSGTLGILGGRLPTNQVVVHAANECLARRGLSGRETDQFQFG